MQTSTSTRRRRTAACLIATLSALSVPAEAPAAKGPKVDQLVVFRSGKALEQRVRAAATTVRVGRRRCAAGRGTPLAALLRARPGRLSLKDYGSCSRRASDSGQLFVRAIRRDRNRGANGWVYKVGNRVGSAGAADPAGPFGRGRLRGGRRVTWFYCVKRAGECQRTLTLKLTPLAGGVVRARVRSYDEQGRGRPAAGATVTGSGVTVTTDAAGMALLSAFPGTRLKLHASQAGLVRSFSRRITAR